MLETQKIHHKTTLEIHKRTILEKTKQKIYHRTIFETQKSTKGQFWKPKVSPRPGTFMKTRLQQKLYSEICELPTLIKWPSLILCSSSESDPASTLRIDISLQMLFIWFLPFLLNSNILKNVLKEESETFGRLHLHQKWPWQCKIWDYFVIAWIWSALTAMPGGPQPLVFAPIFFFTYKWARFFSHGPVGSLVSLRVPRWPKKYPWNFSIFTPNL